MLLYHRLLMQPFLFTCHVKRHSAMMPVKMRNQLERIHTNKKNKDLEYFKIHIQKLRAHPSVNAFINHLSALIVEKD